MIIGVAIKYGDLIIALPKPNRHHDCIRYAAETLGLAPPIGRKGQGFYLATGEYLNREDAMEYMKEYYGQKITINPHILFSEDLW